MHFPMSSLADLEKWPIWPIFFCVGLASSIILFREKKKYVLKPRIPPVSTETDEPTEYPPVETLPDFNWEEKEPLKLRPFKLKYNLTMSMELHISLRGMHLLITNRPRRYNSERTDRNRQKLPGSHHTAKENHGRPSGNGTRRRSKRQTSCRRVLHLARANLSSYTIPMNVSDPTGSGQSVIGIPL